LIPDIAQPGSIKKYFVKVGPIAESTEYAARSQIVWYRNISLLIAEFLDAPGTISRS
jgi:hypothetical protein